uniref:Protein kinase domain-containing protein n=1 Tax=Panagrolaimus superbus TaxID=310955 RepID=A0A914ZC42_9BILA
MLGGSSLFNLQLNYVWSESVNVHFKDLLFMKKKWFNTEGSAAVEFAIDQKTGRECVTKLLSKSPGPFERTEAEFLRKLQHKFIIQYIAENNFNGEIVLLMEWGGVSLSQAIQCYPKKILNNFLLYSYQMSLSLAFIHRKGVIHRDLKAANYVLKNNIVKLIDFGHATYKIVGGIKSTWLVGPPELLAGMSYDQSMDIWDLGLTFTHMVNGKHTFSEKGKDLLKNILRTFDRLSVGEIPEYDVWYSKMDKMDQQVDYAEKISFDVKISNDFADIINSCLHINPTKRITSEELSNHSAYSKFNDC